MSKNLNDFVIETISDLGGLNKDNGKLMKELVRKTIDYYNLKTYEEVEHTDLGTVRVLHLHSIVDENLLTKVIELSANVKTHLSVEAVYEGYIIRYY